ncbi:MAG: VWA domain-containing protein [Cyanobacteriota bacterium]|nr:VWA domain-containing protein [Cyanobacteriota bacterium]
MKLDKNIEPQTFIQTNTISDEDKLKKFIETNNHSNLDANSDLINRDYTIIIDISGSMATTDYPQGTTRWVAAQKYTLALAKKCEQLDPDGITVYMFAENFQRYDFVTSSKVKQIFEENNPQGGANLLTVLQDAINNYFQRKTNNKIKSSGETILVVTDGVSSNRIGISQAIIDATQRIDNNQELRISFIQVGYEPHISKAIKSWEDELQGNGAKFDIVNSVTLDEINKMTMTQVFINPFTE